MNALPPRPLSPSPATGIIDEPMIETLVRAFYARVRVDPELGPIFANVIRGDWEPHLQTMMAFWASVILKTGRFKGQPMVKHRALTLVTPAHFSRWLALFRETAEAVCDVDQAALFIDRAERIAESLQRRMFAAPARA